jgi:hypothetical protein
MQPPAQLPPGSALASCSCNHESPKEAWCRRCATSGADSQAHGTDVCRGAVQPPDGCDRQGNHSRSENTRRGALCGAPGDVPGEAGSTCGELVTAYQRLRTKLHGIPNGPVADRPRGPDRSAVALRPLAGCSALQLAFSINHDPRREAMRHRSPASAHPLSGWAWCGPRWPSSWTPHPWTTPGSLGQMVIGRRGDSVGQGDGRRLARSNSGSDSLRRIFAPLRTMRRNQWGRRR